MTLFPEMWYFCAWPLCFSHLTGPLVAISLVKDCLFALSGQPETNQKKTCLPSGICQEKKPLQDLQAWKHSRTLGTTGNIQRKMFPLFLRPLPAYQVPTRLLTDTEFGSRELEKGQRWVGEKHRWLSDGLVLSDSALSHNHNPKKVIVTKHLISG